MTHRRVWLYLFFLILLVLLDTSMMIGLRSTARLNRLLLAEDTLDTIRAQEVSLKQLTAFQDWEKEQPEGFSWEMYLCAYFITGEVKKDRLEWQISHMQEYRREDLERLNGYLTAVWADLQYFPVPVSAVSREAGVSFLDSWMFERTFGGKRGHEGCDIMADINERGRYPVVSMTDGVVEQMGWLTKGGYRIGIRAPHGGYFYYAHLADYAGDFKVGDTVRAGECLGFMGDTGYSEIEGTVGNFDVHLHVGIYANQPDGTEFSINAYWPLKYLENRRLHYIFY